MWVTGDLMKILGLMGPPYEKCYVDGRTAECGIGIKKGFRSRRAHVLALIRKDFSSVGVEILINFECRPGSFFP
jgi:hypothetical protein